MEVDACFRTRCTPRENRFFLILKVSAEYMYQMKETIERNYLDYFSEFVPALFAPRLALSATN